MTDSTTRFHATAYKNGEVTGRIEDVPHGNITEFQAAHLLGQPWTPEVIADRVEIERSDTNE